jgi:hypothetical protein
LHVQRQPFVPHTLTFFLNLRFLSGASCLESATTDEFHDAAKFVAVKPGAVALANVNYHP